MKRFKINLTILLILLAVTIALGAFAQKYITGSTGYHVLSALAVVGCVAMFVILCKLIINLVVDMRK